MLVYAYFEAKSRHYLFFKVFNSLIPLKNYITHDSAENIHQSENHKKKIVPSNILFPEVSLKYCHCNVFISIMSFTMIKVVLSLIQAVKFPVLCLFFPYFF